MRAGTTGTSTINPWMSSNPSSTAQAQQSESRAVPPQWLPVFLASSPSPPPSSPPPPLPPPSPSPPSPPPPPSELWSAELVAMEKRIEERHAAELVAMEKRIEERHAAQLEAMEKRIEERHAAQLEAHVEARVEAVRNEFYEQIQDVRQCSGCMSPSPPPPSPSPPPPSPSPPPSPPSSPPPSPPPPPMAYRLAPSGEARCTGTANLITNGFMQGGAFPSFLTDTNTVPGGGPCSSSPCTGATGRGGTLSVVNATSLFGPYSLSFVNSKSSTQFTKASLPAGLHSVEAATGDKFTFRVFCRAGGAHSTALGRMI
eukprot:scaffold28509_cov61-Phaeocystis_antarctica.AAC.1